MRKKTASIEDSIRSTTPGPVEEISLTSPLGLSARQGRKTEGFDFIPFLDFAGILLLFGLMGAGFVFTPGFTFDLPESRGEALTGVSAAAVISLRPNMILFDGSRHNLTNLETHMRQFIEGRRERAGEALSLVLLVKMDKDVPMSLFLEISEIARAAGFDRVQVAAEARKADNQRDSFLFQDRTRSREGSAP